MNNPLNKKCVPFEGGILPFDISEIHEYQKKVDGWDVGENNKDNLFYMIKNDDLYKLFKKKGSFNNELSNFLLFKLIFFFK